MHAECVNSFRSLAYMLDFKLLIKCAECVCSKEVNRPRAQEGMQAVGQGTKVVSSDSTKAERANRA